MADLTVSSVIDTLLGSADQPAARSNLGLGTAAVSDKIPSFDYVQMTEPGSPTAGQTWREITAGNLITAEWEWTGSVWASIQRFSVNTGLIATSSTVTSELTIFPYMKDNRTLLERVSFGVRIGVDVTAGTFSCDFGLKAGNLGTNPSTVYYTISKTGITQSANNGFSGVNYPNVLIPIVGDSNTLGLATPTGTVAVGRCSFSFLIRRVR